jgi:putative N6-adenine-specific DNA methylase/tRNA (guanine6-N2)-methyltransferase
MLRFTTNQGFEDIVVNEVNSLLAARRIPPGNFTVSPYGVRGNVLYEHTGATEEILELIPQMRSIYHAVQYLDHRSFEDQNFLTPLLQWIETVEVPELEHTAGFRVSCNRRGTHPFKSPEVERKVGAVLQRRYGAPVDLEGFDTEVRIDIFDTDVFAGIQLTPESMDKRYQKDFHQRVATRSVIAYGLLNLAGALSKPGSILDPFCGSGTILLEAASLLPDVRLYGMDISEEAVEGTRRNLENAGAAERALLMQGDARQLSALLPPDSADYLITDPPLGIRLGKHINYYALFSALLQEADTVLTGRGRIVLLTMRHRGILNRVVKESTAFRILHVRVIEYGGIYPALFLLGRRDPGASTAPSGTTAEQQDIKQDE